MQEVAVVAWHYLSAGQTRLWTLGPLLCRGIGGNRLDVAGGQNAP